MQIDTDFPRQARIHSRMMGQMFLQKMREFVPVVGENTLELIANLIAMVMVMVERRLGQEGLGIYSYLLSLYVIGGYAFEFGVPRYVEREIPRDDARQDRVIKRERLGSHLNY